VLPATTLPEAEADNAVAELRQAEEERLASKPGPLDSLWPYCLDKFTGGKRSFGASNALCLVDAPHPYVHGTVRTSFVNTPPFTEGYKDDVTPLDWVKWASRVGLRDANLYNGDDECVQTVPGDGCCGMHAILQHRNGKSYLSSSLTVGSKSREEIIKNFLTLLGKLANCQWYEKRGNAAASVVVGNRDMFCLPADQHGHTMHTDYDPADWGATWANEYRTLCNSDKYAFMVQQWGRQYGGKGAAFKESIANEKQNWASALTICKAATATDGTFSLILTYAPTVGAGGLHVGPTVLLSPYRLNACCNVSLVSATMAWIHWTGLQGVGREGENPSTAKFYLKSKVVSTANVAPSTQAERDEVIANIPTLGPDEEVNEGATRPQAGVKLNIYAEILNAMEDHRLSTQCRSEGSDCSTPHMTCGLLAFLCDDHFSLVPSYHQPADASPPAPKGKSAANRQGPVHQPLRTPAGVSTLRTPNTHNDHPQEAPRQLSVPPFSRRYRRNQTLTLLAANYSSLASAHPNVSVRSTSPPSRAMTPHQGNPHPSTPPLSTLLTIRGNPCNTLSSPPTLANISSVPEGYVTIVDIAGWRDIVNGDLSL
jgi:hypothetical protein